MKNTINTINTISAIYNTIIKRKERSAWDRGVTEYAQELLTDLEMNVDIYPDDISNARLFERALLNGASDWAQYSWGGCSLIYDGQIANRLCTMTELKKTANGMKRPNAREEWLDVQARALYQAAQLILRTYAEVTSNE
jgi:hypothetical protein